MAEWLRDEYGRRASRLPRIGGKRGPSRWVEATLVDIRNDLEELERFRARKSDRDAELQRRVLRQTNSWEGQQPWFPGPGGRPRGFRQALLNEYPKDGEGRLRLIAVKAVHVGAIVPAAHGEWIEPVTVVPSTVPSTQFASRAWAMRHGAPGIG